MNICSYTSVLAYGTKRFLSCNDLVIVVGAGVGMSISYPIGLCNNRGMTQVVNSLTCATNNTLDIFITSRLPLVLLQTSARVYQNSQFQYCLIIIKPFIEVIQQDQSVKQKALPQSYSYIAS